MYLNGYMVHLGVKGASLNSWINDIEHNRKSMVTKVLNLKEIGTGDQGTKSEYKFMVFEFGEEIDGFVLPKAEDADRELQEYLKKYLSKNGTSIDREPGQDEEDHTDTAYDTDD